ncbi:MAG: hypothetical protein NC251_09690 [Lachnoclostridium sp.]|nr:hypothetical protein [Lachnospira sp.]MCM1248691.1 hypothetical protein [Lachnoclostridium sp.]MCM1534940.1 hypothetical protein [Clostridium sp.]
MIDWEEIIRAESVEELRDAKLFLFQENMRIQKEQKKIEEQRQELTESQDKFLVEKDRFQGEMEELNRHIIQERKRLREETLFFDKKMEILKDGFRHLEEDRKSLERDKDAFARERKLLTENRSSLESDDIGEILFRSANNSIGLRKRYKDLVKIFHPDNLFGDAELAQLINKEFQRRKKIEN